MVDVIQEVLKYSVGYALQIHNGPLIPHPQVIVLCNPATGLGLGAHSMHLGHVLVKMVVQSQEILHHLSTTLYNKVAPLL